MLLGVVLLLIIQRALIAIYIIVSDGYPAYDFLTNTQLQIVNWATIGFAVLIGLVYGNYLGHHWYPLVYEQDENSNNSTAKNSDSTPQQKTVVVKPVRVARAKVNLKSEIKEDGWDFDDLLNKDVPAVENLGSSAPVVSSAVSLGESSPDKPKHVVVRKTKMTVPSKTTVKKGTTVKTGTKTVAKKNSVKTPTKTTAKKTGAKAKSKVEVE